MLARTDLKTDLESWTQDGSIAYSYEILTSKLIEPERLQKSIFYSIAFKWNTTVTRHDSAFTEHRVVHTKLLCFPATSVEGSNFYRSVFILTRQPKESNHH